MANIGYALDILGTNPNNKVSETRTLTKKAIDGRAFVIPKAAPFFAEGVVVVSNGVRLIENKDYHLILVSEELSHTTERKVVGGILFNTLAVNTQVSFDVQTIGGDFNLPIGNTTENLARLIRNPTFTTWSQLVGTPAGLPTHSHVHDWGSTVGWEGFIAKFEQLINVLLLSSGTGSGSDSAFLVALQNHLKSTTAHTPAAVGLGNLSNFTLAQDADYNTLPYPNNKYVTPRSVMYAITRFIGNELKVQQELIDQLEDTLNSNTNAYKDLVNEWNDLQLTLRAVNQNYSTMVTSVNAYKEDLLRFEQEYRNIGEQQELWNAKVSEFNQTVRDYGKQYEDFIKVRDQLLTGFETMTTAFTEHKELVTEVSTAITSLTTRIDSLEKHGMYPESKILTAGSLNFKIKPGQKFAITLIGAGGGVGEYITESANTGAIYNGEHGGSTSLFCMQDLTNGEFSPSSQAVAIAGGGFGAIATYGNPTGAVTTHGIGGRGGNFRLHPSIVPEEASNGEGGLKGYGNYVKGDLTTQDMGYEYFGNKFGKGATTENALGQGGEAAIVRFRFENKLKVDLEFMLVVGVAGRSYNPDKSNATGGLAILTLIK